MWFNHRAAAVEGVGFGHKVMASLGLRWFEIEVIVVPPSQGGGGSGPATLWDIDKPYQVVVRIKYKDKVWEERQQVSALAGKSLAKVLASFKFMKTSTIEVVASINNILQRSINVLWRK